MKINQILCALVVTLGLTVGPGCGDETDSAPGESPPSGVSPEVGSGNASGDTGGGTDEDPSDPGRPSDPAPGAAPAPTPTPTPSPGADSVDVAFSAVPSSGGSVVATPAGAVTAGTQVTFEAIPEQGYRFVSWTGIAASSATATVIVRSDTQAVANFERIPVSLNVNRSPTEGGRVTLTPDGPYLYGDTVVVSAEPAEGYRFDGWSTGPVTAEQTLTLTADVTLTANFSRIPVTLTLNSAPAGVGLYTVSPPAPHFYGDTVTVTARTQPGWNFRRWRNRTTAATFSVQLTRDVTFTAEYEPYPVLSGPDRHIGNDTTYRITWVFAGSPTSYTIEESYDGSSYRAFQTVRTSDTAVGIDIPVDRAPGTHCYRVRASGPGQASVPSNEHCVERAPGPRQVRIVNDLPSWRQSVGEVNAIVSVKFAPVIGSINWDTISESMRHSPRSLPGESIRPQGDSMTFAIPTSYPTTYSMFFGAGWYDGIVNPFPPYNFQGYERRLTRVFGCDCTTTVFKAEPLQINHTFDTLTINASQFMARADYCGDPVCR